MKLIAALSLVACTLALPQQAQQLPFAPASSIYSRALLQQLASLPHSHAEQLLQHISALPEKRWIQFEENGGRFEVTEGEKALLVFEGRRFIDVTEESELLTMQKQGEWLLLQLYIPADPHTPAEIYPKKLEHSASDLKALFSHISIKNMSAFLDKFTSFYTRYYRSPTGRESQLFLLNHVKEVRRNSLFGVEPLSWGRTIH